MFIKVSYLRAKIIKIHFCQRILKEIPKADAEFSYFIGQSPMRQHMLKDAD